MRSRIGLNAANFLQAEAVAVVLPILNTYLREAHLRHDQIGMATAIAGLGTLLFQTPAGYLTDKISSRRALFAIAPVSVGIGFGLVLVVPKTVAWIDSILFGAGVLQSLFFPVLGALALALVGRESLNRTLGENQAWNHAGNIVAALLAFFAVSRFGSGSIFLLGRRGLFWGSIHLANAPILPMTALYIKKLGSSDALTTFTVLSAQTVMAPVACLAGKLCDSIGRKATLAVAFWVLPFRIASYVLAHNSPSVVVLQSLDGIGAGISGVAIIGFAAGLTKDNGHFNTLLGLFATAQAVGGVAGPAIEGFVLQHFGFSTSFLSFAMLASAGAFLYQFTVRDTVENQH